jgi:hypothetical protein
MAGIIVAEWHVLASTRTTCLAALLCQLGNGRDDDVNPRRTRAADNPSILGEVQKSGKCVVSSRSAPGDTGAGFTGCSERELKC